LSAAALEFEERLAAYEWDSRVPDGECLLAGRRLVDLAMCGVETVDPVAILNYGFGRATSTCAASSRRAPALP
jgi:hypothetical protein